MTLSLLAEIARQAAQIKLMRKLEKQAMARAAKEARKQQGEQTQTTTSPCPLRVLETPPPSIQNISPLTMGSHNCPFCFCFVFVPCSHYGSGGEEASEGADEDSQAAGEETLCLPPQPHPPVFAFHGGESIALLVRFSYTK